MHTSLIFSLTGLHLLKISAKPLRWRISSVSSYIQKWRTPSTSIKCSKHQQSCRLTFCTAYSGNSFSRVTGPHIVNCIAFNRTFYSHLLLPEYSTYCCLLLGNGRSPSDSAFISVWNVLYRCTEIFSVSPLKALALVTNPLLSAISLPQSLQQTVHYTKAFHVSEQETFLREESWT